MTRNYLLRDVSPLGEGTTDVLLADGIIAAIGAGAEAQAQDPVIINGSGLVLLPGLVDLHTHLRVPERTVSASSRPGSRRCVWRSTRPGSRIRPLPLMITGS